jgi:GNAT superfamily N-acetyltransferase
MSVTSDGMNLSVLKKKLQRNLYDYGFLIALRKSINYLLKPVYMNITYRIYRIDIDKVEIKTRKDSTFDFRMIGSDEHEIIRQIEDMEEWLKGKVASMLASGGICHVVLDGTSLAGFNLVSFDEGCLLLAEYRRRLKKNEAWSQQISVKRGYRRQGLATALRQNVIKELKKRGITRMYGGTQTGNNAALRLAGKVGFRDIANLHYRKLFSYRKMKFRRIKNEYAG